MCEVKNGRDYSKAVADEVDGNRTHYFESDGNGGFIVSKNTAVSLGLVVLIIGGVLGFFTTWAIPAVRLQEVVRSHLEADAKEMKRYDERISALEASLPAAALVHQAQHQAEFAAMKDALGDLTVTVSQNTTVLRSLERAVEKLN